MKQKHQKHANIARPSYGFFHRNEWAIIGSPCPQIQELSRLIIRQLSNKYHIGYVDADHASEDQEQSPNGLITQGATLNYTDKIQFHRFDQKTPLGSYQYRMMMNNEDFVIVNGNHFTAKRQIVVIDPKKADSLRRKLDRLTHVDLFLLADGVTELPADLMATLASQSPEDIPVYSLKNVDAITNFLADKMAKSIAQINGLVLAGGKSRRMGRDKGKMNYYGKPQREYVQEITTQLCTESYLSCRPEQAADPDLFGMPLIFDSFSGLGPFGAILSAFREHPERAWLVVACDLPLIDEETLAYLISHRNPSKLATAFNSPDHEFPEPLITIYEPRSYPVLLQFLAQGYSCPRKVLINSDVELIEAPDTRALTNVNTPEDLERVKGWLKSE